MNIELSETELDLVLQALEEWVDMWDEAMDDINSWTADDHVNCSNSKKLYKKLKQQKYGK